MRTILVALLLVLLFGGTAVAQNSVKLEKGDSVWSVMASNKCDFGWLSQVLKDSNIKAKNVRRLPIGQEVNLSTCNGRAPKMVRAESLAVLRVDRTPQEVVTSEVATPEAGLAKAQLDAATARADKAETDVARLQNEVKDLGLARQKAEREAVAAKNEATAAKNEAAALKADNGNSFLANSGLVISGMVLAAAVFILLARTFLKRRVFAVKNKIVNIRGRTIELSLGQVEIASTGELTHLWRCAHCTTLLADDDIQPHIEADHMDAAGLVTSRDESG